jgi:anaerobic ribonucleoside-triphosphate reductase
MFCDDRLIAIMDSGRCHRRTEVYSRVCGYFRPVSEWNRGKREEFRQRKTYKST